MKDPDFPFHSEKYYEGTRTMLPEERACYIDLMIYQHQNGTIPDDPKRMLLYCSGITADVLQSTLKAKFVLRENGWVNLRLEEILSHKRRFSETQSVNGKVGQFWKKAKSLLTKADYNRLRDYFSELQGNELYDQLQTVELSEKGLKSLLSDEPQKPTAENWKTSYQVYLDELDLAFTQLTGDADFIAEQERLNPNLDIILTMDKARRNYWATDEAWKTKKKSRTKNINWKSTFINALSIRMNKAWKQHENTQTSTKRRTGIPDNSAAEKDIISRITKSDH